METHPLQLTHGDSPPQLGGLSPITIRNFPAHFAYHKYNLHFRQSFAIRSHSSRGVSWHLHLGLCLYRHLPSSGFRCVHFSLLQFVKLRRDARSFPSADPASPTTWLRHHRLLPIKRLASLSRARLVHRITRRKTYYRSQCKLNRSYKSTSENL